jgi:hypothetical protein
LNRLDARFEGETMKDRVSRRGFLKVAGVSLGFGALYRVAPLLGTGGEGTHLARLLGRKNGERVTPFSFVQLSDTHVGFSGPPNPLGTQAFEKAVDARPRLPGVAAPRRGLDFARDGSPGLRGESPPHCGRNVALLAARRRRSHG